MDRKKSSIIIILVLVLLLCCLGIIGVLVIKNKQASDYDRYITTANKYYQAADYENAIVSYEEALKINDKDVEAYEGIARTYRAMNNTPKAIEYLQKGYNKTKSTKLKNMLDEYSNLEAESSITYSVEQVQNNSGAVTLRSDVFAMFSSYSYAQYSTVYETSQDATATELSYNGIPAKFVYASAPIENSRPSYIQITSLDLIFDGVVSGVSYDRLGELDIFGLGLVEDPSRYNLQYCIEFMYRGCHVVIESDESGNIIKQNPWAVVMLTSSNESSESQSSSSSDIEDEAPETGYCLLKGVAYNAAAGGSTEKVTLKIYSGSTPSDKDLYTQLDTDIKGNYRLDIEPGQYYIEVIYDKEAVYGQAFELLKPDIVEKLDLPYSIERELREGEIRVILSWDDPNGNLNHYLWGSNSDGEPVSCWHSAYDEGNHWHTDSNGELVISSGPEVVGGPEELTVFDIGGHYEYSVMSDGYTSIAGARVEVYTAGSNTPIVFECPDDYVGDYWDVFVYENGDVHAM